MFYDELFDNIEQLNQHHEFYGMMADAIDTSLHLFLLVLQETESQALKSGNDIHAVTLMLMYDFAESIDGVAVLVRKGAARNCAQLLRTALEIGLALRYIVENAENFERRSLAYEYFHLDGRLKWSQKCDPKHESGLQLKRELADDPFAGAFDVRERGIDIKGNREIWERKLLSPRYVLVRDEIDRIKNGKKKAKSEGRAFGESASNWFSLWGGPKDIRTLAIRLKLLSMYESLYRNWSSVSHGGAAMDRIGESAGGGLVSITPLRSPKGLRDQCIHACHLTNGLVLKAIEKLVPQMRETMTRCYTDHIRPAMDFIRNSGN